MVDISSGDKKINITVSTSGNKASVNATPDTAMYYSNKSREWAISDKIVSNEDYSSKYYANVSKKQAETVKDKITEVNNAVEVGITNIINQENISVDNVNTAGATQVNLAKEQAMIATNKAEEASGIVDNAVSNIVAKGTEQITLIQNEGATQIANVQSTGFYMRDDKLYFINSQGEETEFKSGGSGLEVCDIGMALYVDETKGLRRYLNGQIVDINTNTQAFLTRLLEIKTTNPDYFTNEETWQSEATLNVDGCVYKFVLNYDSTGTNVTSVRLPKYPDYVEVSAGSNLKLKNTKLKLYYFIQIATGSETENNIVNEIELNNPYSLFDSKYSDHELNNLSWLKSEGQWNPKSTYPTAYDKLLKVYNGTETVEGLSVKLSTESYTDYDFVLNTSDETFRLPLKNHTADDSIEVLTLYFYVGETVQNANLIDAGRIGEELSNKVDINSKVIDGQWIFSNKELSASTTAGTYTIDMSKYLPNDSYQYEVLLKIQQASTNNNATLTALASDVFSTKICIAITSTVTVDCVNCFSWVVGSKRVLTKTIEGPNCNSNKLLLIAYRRLGTNI